MRATIANTSLRFYPCPVCGLPDAVSVMAGAGVDVSEGYPIDLGPIAVPDPLAACGHLIGPVYSCQCVVAALNWVESLLRDGVQPLDIVFPWGGAHPGYSRVPSDPNARVWLTPKEM